MGLLSAALEYARQGYSVFPCLKKMPLTSSGYKNATTDCDTIRRWWTDNEIAQIGLPTGQINHLFCIDMDSPQAAEVVKQWHLPETRTILTRPGRWQLWFHQADGVETKCSAGVLAPELDTRGDGGYVIAPPSLHHETRMPYRIVKDLPLADTAGIPAYVLKPEKENVPPAANRLKNEITQGTRHATLLSLAGSLRTRGFSRDAVLKQLEITNLSLCKPPLLDSEIEKLADYVGTKPAVFRSSFRPMETSAEVVIECFSEVLEEKVHQLWHNRVALGKLTLFVGNPGQGKSLAAVDIASRLSRGADFPDGAPCEIGDTVFLAAEDDARDTQKPRLMAADAYIPRVHRVKATRVVLADGQTGEASFNLERDIERLTESLRQIPSTKLLVADPLTAYLGKVDSHKEAEVRGVLLPLVEMAAKYRIAVIGIMHLNKSQMDALFRVTGSIGFVATARAVWVFGPDPTTPGNHVMAFMKSNIAPVGGGLSYRIETVAVGDLGPIPYIAWQPGTVYLSADDVLSSENRESKSKRGEAQDWLTEFLSNGPMPEQQIRSRAKQDGFSWATVRRAKKDLCAKSQKASFGGPWIWELPGR